MSKEERKAVVVALTKDELDDALSYCIIVDYAVDEKAPFKCYIYEREAEDDLFGDDEDWYELPDGSRDIRNGKIVAECVVSKVIVRQNEAGKDYYYLYHNGLKIYRVAEEIAKFGLAEAPATYAVIADGEFGDGEGDFEVLNLNLHEIYDKTVYVPKSNHTGKIKSIHAYYNNRGQIISCILYVEGLKDKLRVQDVQFI